MIKKIHILMVATCLIGCSSPKQQNQENSTEDSLPVINLSENVTEVQSLPLSEAAQTIEVIPLEMTNTSVIGEINHLQVTSSDIWVTHYKDNTIFRFSRSGKFLNKVGTIGQGPKEYVQLDDFFINDERKEVNIVCYDSGIQVYDYEGNYLRKMASALNAFFICSKNQFIYFQQQLFLGQNLSVIRPIDNPKDSLWSLALVDDKFNLQKIWKNPAHIGREEDIIEHYSNTEKIVNYWQEGTTSIDLYNQELTLKFPDTDTIYRYENEGRTLVPQYAIYTNQPKGDYDELHRFIKDRKAFSYFSVFAYYPTKDFIYLKAYKGETISHYAYNRHDGTVKKAVRQGKLVERKLPWFTQPFIGFMEGTPFAFSNDTHGGHFDIDYRSSGKYWIDVIEPDSEKIQGLIEEVEASETSDATKKGELLTALRNMTEESNPLLIIATLK